VNTQAAAFDHLRQADSQLLADRTISAVRSIEAAVEALGGTVARKPVQPHALMLVPALKKDPATRARTARGYVTTAIDNVDTGPTIAVELLNGALTELDDQDADLSGPPSPSLPRA
jgi:hypothetical protein